MNLGGALDPAGHSPTQSPAGWTAVILAGTLLGLPEMLTVDPGQSDYFRHQDVEHHV